MPNNRIKAAKLFALTTIAAGTLIACQSLREREAKVCDDTKGECPDETVNVIVSDQ